MVVEQGVRARNEPGTAVSRPGAVRAGAEAEAVSTTLAGARCSTSGGCRWSSREARQRRTSSRPLARVVSTTLADARCSTSVRV
jgi:hypothetical protein